MTTSPTAVRAASVAIAVLALLAAVAGLAHRGALADDHFAVTLTVTHLTGVLGDGSVPVVAPDEADAATEPPAYLDVRTLIHNRDTTSLDQLRLVVEIHQPVDSRPDLHRILQAGASGPALSIFDVDVRDGGTVDADDIAGAHIRVPVANLPFGDQPAVYPVRVALVRGIEVIDAKTTALIWLPETPLAPMKTTMFLPFDTPPTRQPAGRYDAGTDQVLTRGERLDRVLTAVEGGPPGRATLLIAPHLLDELGDRANGFVALEGYGTETVQQFRVEPEDRAARAANDLLQRLRRAVAADETAPVATIYGRADLDGLLSYSGSSAVRDLARLAIQMGRTRTQAALDLDVDPSTVVLTDPVHAPVFDELEADATILPSNAAVRSGAQRFDRVRPVRASDNRAIWTVVADDYLSNTAVEVRDESPALAVQRFLASSVQLYLEDRDASDRVLAILPPSNWAPQAGHVAALLDALDTSTWLEPVDPHRLLSEGRRSHDEIRLVPQQPGPPLPATFLTSLATANTSLATARSIAASAKGATPVDQPSLDDLQQTLITATSQWLRGARLSFAEQLVDQVQAAAVASVGTIDVGASRVTLTSDSGTIPVALHRPSGDDAMIMIEVVSPGRLAWPEGRRSELVMLPSHGYTTVAFATRALSTGTFPVTVRVLDPTGQHELQRATLPVRSTAFSRPALMVTAAIVALLLVIGLSRQRTALSTTRRRSAGGFNDRR